MTELVSGEESSVIRVKVEIRDDTGSGSGNHHLTLDTKDNGAKGQGGHNNNQNVISGVEGNNGSCALSNKNIAASASDELLVKRSTLTDSSGSRTTPPKPINFTSCASESGTCNNNNLKASQLDKEKGLKLDNLNLKDGFTNSGGCREVKGLSPQLKLNVGQGGNDSFETATREELLSLCHQLQNYMKTVERRHQDELVQVKESEEKLKVQNLEASRRENVLVMRLTTKEQEMQEYAAQLNELKASMIPNSGVLRSTLLDPAVNFVIQRMKTELEETKKKLEDTQNDLNAWKFTPDSNTGKRLMAKCRMLYQENEELGKMVSSGRLAKLESDLALQKSLTVEMKKSQSELDELVQELDEDVEGMQSTILFLQQQIRKPNSNSAGEIEGTPSISDSLGENSNSTKMETPHNCPNSETSPDGFLKVRISDLCARCRTLEESSVPMQLTLTSATLDGVARTPSQTPVTIPKDPPLPPVDNFDRTCVNEEERGNDDEPTPTKSTSNQSVLNIVKHANECDETDGEPPSSKRTKLHGDTAVLENDHGPSQQSFGGGTSSCNGNGSVEY